jgi:hypothetical protein
MSNSLRIFLKSRLFMTEKLIVLKKRSVCVVSSSKKSTIF